MKITRIAAVSIILATGLSTGAGAQTIRSAAEPAEFPPTSYQGRQYVDSKGCIFIRAGVDGNVNWVPRVNRARQQLCGAEPTAVAGTTKNRPVSQQGPDVITLAPEEPAAVSGPAAAQDRAPDATAATATGATAAAAAARVAAARPPVTTVRPERTPASTSTGAAVVPRRVLPAEQPTPQPVRPATAPVPQPIPAPATGPCAGASALSQQYINKGPGVRCGPQREDPLSTLTPDTRILPRHLYEERLLLADVRVPEGYRPAWQDGRLNPHRAERTIRPAVLASPSVPKGYMRVNRDDNRMSASRGMHTAAGEAQMAQVWTNGLPRKQVLQPLDKVPFSLRKAQRLYAAELAQTQTEPQTQVQTGAQAGTPGRSAAGQDGDSDLVLRLSTRSAAGAPRPAADRSSAPARYIRAATFADPAEAQAVAHSLAEATGLIMRLGTVTRGSQTYSVVLSGPYTGSAQKALRRVQAAGFKGARLSN
ncbi:SPOR domain-containing protein [Phaeobacter sp. B1627]|uniref:SPOR domain-containing protein n=1 Tax=Phaeobacter sp. B1627 TaxID=2583809 RepID=UPI001118ADBC|nr:SPOR domain-containing protein [Phaeobacter sp. B1627]TNJ43971.1 SPOR domain-containing protein [Phaeobacter sp. B1627]